MANLQNLVQDYNKRVKLINQLQFIEDNQVFTAYEVNPEDFGTYDDYSEAVGYLKTDFNRLKEQNKDKLVNKDEEVAQILADALPDEEQKQVEEEEEKKQQQAGNDGGGQKKKFVDKLKFWKKGLSLDKIKNLQDFFWNNWKKNLNILATKYNIDTSDTNAIIFNLSFNINDKKSYENAHNLAINAIKNLVGESQFGFIEDDVDIDLSLKKPEKPKKQSKLSRLVLSKISRPPDSWYPVFNAISLLLYTTSLSTTSYFIQIGNTSIPLVFFITIGLATIVTFLSTPLASPGIQRILPILIGVSAIFCIVGTILIYYVGHGNISDTRTLEGLRKTRLQRVTASHWYWIMQIYVIMGVLSVSKKSF